MILNLEQIKSITVGALDVWQEEDGFYFARCTPKQVEEWYKIRQDLGRNAESTAGVRLDFHTNSKLFSFTPSKQGKYEIYIDDVLTYYYVKDDFADGMKKEISLDGAEHRITLYLPAHSKGILEAVEIDDGATITVHKFDCKMLFIGDSITQGWDSTWDSLSYAQCASRFFNAESVNQGISGSMFREEPFDANIAFEPDIVIVAYGTNDWNYFRDIEKAKEHCSKFLDAIVERYGGKKIFGISPIWRKDKVKNTAMGSFEACTSYVKENIISHGMILIDGETLTPHHEDFYFDKFLHPNTIGFEIYALNLIMQISKVVAKSVDFD